MVLVGFIEMKENKGKILFVEQKFASGKGYGSMTDKIFCYDNTAVNIDESCIGCELDVIYRRGYNGRAYVERIEVL